MWCGIYDNKRIILFNETIKCIIMIQKDPTRKVGDYGKYNDIQKFIHDNGVLVQLTAIYVLNIIYKLIVTIHSFIR